MINVPVGWEVKRLGDLGEIAGAGVDKKSQPGEMPVRLLNYMDVYRKDFLGTNDFRHKVTARLDQVKRCAVRRGDVFFTPTSEVRDDIGHSAVAIEDVPDVVYSYHVVRLRLFENWDLCFRAQVFKSKYFLEQASTQCEGSGIRYVLTLSKFRNLAVQYPTDVQEQQRIGTILSDMDAHVNAMARLLAKKKAVKAAMAEELLTGKRRLEGFSGAWKVLAAKEIGSFSGGNGFPLSAQGKTNGDYPFFKVSDMNHDGNETFMITSNHYISEHVRAGLGVKLFPEGTIVFAKVGAAVFLERKKILKRPSCIDNNIAAFVVNKELADVGYVHAFLLNTKIGALVNTTALPSLNAKILGEMTLVVPPLPEQTAIATILSDMDADIHALAKKLEKHKKLKEAMAHQLLTGAIRV